MKPKYKRVFVQYAKKAHKLVQLAIEDAVALVCDSRDIGELKVGDLTRLLERLLHGCARHQECDLVA